MIHSIQSKLPQLGTTIFTVMSQLAVEHNAINLGQGFPDYQMSEELIQLVNKAMMDGYNQYTHMNGLPQLTQAIAEKIKFLYNAETNPQTQITVTPGGTYAIYTALTTVLQPGDEVIVFEPAYDSYIPNIEINKAVPVLIPLQFPHYNIPWHEVKNKITSKTKMIIINSPHNPTGSVLSEADMQQLIAITQNTGILILSDEVYEHLVYDGLQHQSVLRHPQLAERSFACFSFGKTYNCTGWKIGYCVAPPALMHEFRKVHQYNCFSCNTPVQVALATYLQNKEAYLNLSTQLQQKRDHFNRLMLQTPFTKLASHGSYFQCYSYGHITNETDTNLAMRLTKELGVASIPLSVFYKNGKDDKVLRFCFSKKDETLEKAVEKLAVFKA